MRTDCTVRLFDELAESYFSADIRVANLESPIYTTKQLSTPGLDITSPPQMNNTEEAFDICYQNGAGVNVFSTANNHALDQGIDGLLATLDFLDAKGAAHTGTSRSSEERDDLPVIEIKGIRIAFLSWTFSFNKQVVPAGCEHMVNHLRLNVPDCELDPLVRQVHIARQEQGADVVVACLHWGLEYEVFPLSSLMDTAHRIIEAGVDIIAGNHAHGLQPVECYVYKGANGRRRIGLITYSLGDFISDAPHLAHMGLSAILQVRLSQNPFYGQAGNTEKFQFLDARLTPYYAYRSYDAAKRCVDFRLLPFSALNESALAEGLPDGKSRLIFSSRQARQIRMLRKILGKAAPSH
jgi:poly-gamma-glutamate synthesis protein (capsule biosynthesis protein)